MLFILKIKTKIWVTTITFLISLVLGYEIYICYDLYCEYKKLSNISLKPENYLINLHKYETLTYMNFPNTFNGFENLQITSFYNYSNSFLFTVVETTLILDNINSYLLILHTVLEHQLNSEFLSQYTSTFSLYSSEIETRGIKAFSNSQLIYLSKWIEYSLYAIQENTSSAGLILDESFKIFQDNFQKLSKFTLKPVDDNTTTVANSRVWLNSNMRFQEMNQAITDAITTPSIQNEEFLNKKIDYLSVDKEAIKEIKNNQIQSKIDFNYSIKLFSYTFIFLGVFLGGIYFLPNELLKI